MADPSVDLNSLCNLARLPSPNSMGEQQELQSGLQQILAFFRMIDAIDTKNVEPLFQPFQPESAPERDDKLVTGLDRSDALANAPESDGRHFLVPQVLK